MGVSGKMGVRRAILVKNLGFGEENRADTELEEFFQSF